MVNKSKIFKYFTKKANDRKEEKNEESKKKKKKKGIHTKKM